MNTQNSQPGIRFGPDLLVLVGLALAWAQLYYSATPVWIHGDYYDYAWFVPPISAFFFFRYWQQRPPLERSRLTGRGLFLVSVFLLPFLFAIRAIEGFDPTWRPPMMLHAILIALTTHWVLWRRASLGLSLAMIPATIFALSAIPYPFTLEKMIVGILTEWVVQAAGFLFYFLGRPVQVYGGVIEWNEIKVQVTEGCSGIQSLQSLIMVSLYLGEFFRMKILHRLLLPTFAIVVALSVNVGRAMYLAHVRFEEGEAAFDAAHDGVGVVAFAVGGLALIFIARILIHKADHHKKALRRTPQRHS